MAGSARRSMGEANGVDGAGETCSFGRWSKMILLIDGYNVLHAVGRGRNAGGSTRNRFIELVAVYARARGHEAVIIFDGGSSPYPQESVVDGVTVVESGYRQSADDLLRKKLADYPPETVIVASSDRAITDDAESRGIVSIDADAFYHRLVDVVCDKSATPRIPTAKERAVRFHREGEGDEGLVDDLLNELMEKASAHVRPKKSDIDDQEPRPTRGRKKSKAERRLERVIKKL